MSFGVVEMCDCKCKCRKSCRKPNALSNESCLIDIVTGADRRLLSTAGGGSRGELLRIAAQIHGKWVSLTGASRGEDAAGKGREQEIFSRKYSANAHTFTRGDTDKLRYIRNKSVDLSNVDPRANAIYSIIGHGEFYR